MLRFLGGAVSALLLVAAGFFIWKSRAQSEDPIPPPPDPVPVAAPFKARPDTPPAASEKSKEEKRFARADRDEDGRITAAEMLEPRRKAFGKLDADGNGSLSFEEWAVKTREKFGKADADRSGWLTPAEYASTKARPAKKKACAC